METPVVLDLSGAAISGDPDEQNPPISLPNQPSGAPLIAVDIGGTLTKLVYFSADKEGDGVGGRLHFAKFHNSCLDECLDFIQSNGLLQGNGSSNGRVTIKATGGGGVKYAAIFKEKLGVPLDQIEEMRSNVAGANFLLQRVPYEPFTHMNGKETPIHINCNDLFPYLLVTVGSAASIVKVIGDNKFESEMGTILGGSTVFGLAKLLTGCTSYENFLELSQLGDKRVLDLFIKEKCRGLVCQKQIHSTSPLDLEFEKIITSQKKISDYKAEDLAAALLSMFTNNIAQISFLVAALLGLKRIVFGGSYLHGHRSTMNTISYAVDNWSKGQMETVFLRHDGFLGALGAFMNFERLHFVDFAFEEIKEQVFSNEADGIAVELNDNIFPYLLVDIGSGVSMIEVIEKVKFGRTTRTHLGVDTILSFAKLLTGCTSYNEFLEMAKKGNNLSVDLTCGDIYGEVGNPELGGVSTDVVSSFGKITSRILSDYKVEDLAASLLNAFIFNNGQISHLVASLSGLKRIFFHGNYISCHSTKRGVLSYFHRWCGGQVKKEIIHHEWCVEIQGAWWRYQKDADVFAVHNGMKQILFGMPNVEGKSRVDPNA